MDKQTPSNGEAERERQLSDRLSQLKKQLDGPDMQYYAPTESQDSEAEEANRNSMTQAFRLSSEFIAGVVAGGVIGYLVDRFFNTSPWGLIIFLLLGFAAAVLNVLRAAGMMAESKMRLKPAYELQKTQQKDETDQKIKK